MAEKGKTEEKNISSIDSQINNEKDYKVLARKLDQQIRQVFALEKQLYDTRDEHNKEIVGFKNLQKLTGQILSLGLNSKEVMGFVVKHLLYEMDYEKSLLFFYQNNKLKLGAVGTLLISDELDEKKIEEFEEEAKKVGSEVMIISTETREGVQLREMGKIAAILRYEVGE